LVHGISTSHEWCINGKKKKKQAGIFLYRGINPLVMKIVFFVTENIYTNVGIIY